MGDMTGSVFLQSPGSASLPGSIKFPEPEPFVQRWASRLGYAGLQPCQESRITPDKVWLIFPYGQRRSPGRPPDKLMISARRSPESFWLNLVRTGQGVVTHFSEVGVFPHGKDAEIMISKGALERTWPDKKRFINLEGLWRLGQRWPAEFSVGTGKWYWSERDAMWDFMSDESVFYRRENELRISLGRNPYVMLNCPPGESACPHPVVTAGRGIRLSEAGSVREMLSLPRSTKPVVQVPGILQHVLDGDLQAYHLRINGMRIRALSCYGGYLKNPVFLGFKFFNTFANPQVGLAGLALLAVPASLALAVAVQEKSKKDAAGQETSQTLAEFSARPSKAWAC